MPNAFSRGSAAETRIPDREARGLRKECGDSPQTVEPAAPVAGATLRSLPQLGQLAPPETFVKSCSPAHFRRQTALSAQLIEQPPGQVTSHVDPGLHEALPLPPRVIVHLAPSPQSTLHESPQLPAHIDWLAQASEQLAPQTCVETSHT